MRVPLSQLQPGDAGAVVCTEQLAGDDAAYLAAIGLAERAEVRVCNCRGACIVEIGSGTGGTCRVAIDRSLAERVLVGAAGA